MGAFGIGYTELMIIGIIAVLLFGKNLPKVAKQLGGSYREFQKGLSEFRSHMEIDTTSHYSSRYSGSSSSAPPSSSPDEYDTASAPRFEPPPSEPQPSELRAADVASANPPPASS